MSKNNFYETLYEENKSQIDQIVETLKSMEIDILFNQDGKHTVIAPVPLIPISCVEGILDKESAISEEQIDTVLINEIERQRDLTIKWRRVALIISIIAIIICIFK